MASPTTRSLQELRKEGYTAQVVEHFNLFAKVRVDLFKVIDIVAVREDIDGVLGIQACITGDILKRTKKALETPELLVWLKAGNKFEVWGWAIRGARGKRKKYQLKVKTLTLSDFSSTKGSDSTSTNK